MTLQRRCNLSAGGRGRLIPLNAGKAKWAVRTVLFQQWDDTAKPCVDEGAAIAPTLPIVRSLLLNRFLKWGVSKGAHPFNLDFRQELIFVVLSFLLELEFQSSLSYVSTVCLFVFSEDFLAGCVERTSVRSGIPTSSTACQQTAGEELPC